MTENKLTIKSWSEEDRPREKLLSKGGKNLSTAELLAILIRAGSRNISAVELSKNILAQANNNLIELSKLTVKDLLKFKGIGKTKAITILAALELGKRRREAEVMEKQKITCSKDVFGIFQSMSDNKYEEFWILLLDRANKIIKKMPVSEGGISGTFVDPKKIFKLAIDNSASSIIICHNHPSGNIKPSKSDIELTKKLKEGGALFDMPVVDHIIIGEENYCSFADEGLL